MATVNGSSEEHKRTDSAIGFQKGSKPAESPAPSQHDDYLLTRDVGASARLNLSHYIWHDAYGFNLHPRIAAWAAGKEHLRVADVGTGTAIWLLDLQKALPLTTQLDGIDISFGQCPASGWLPHNVALRQLDVFGEVPSHLIGYYDIIHIRHFVCVIRSNDPQPLLSNLLRMLKPGGWVQWDEWDVSRRQLIKTSPHSPHIMIDKLEEEFKVMRKRTPLPTWPPRLDEFFLDESMQDVAIEKRLSSLSHLPYMHDLTILVFQELIDNAESSKALEPEKLDNLRQLLAGAVRESRLGAAWNLTRCMAIGQKNRR